MDLESVGYLSIYGVVYCELVLQLTRGTMRWTVNDKYCKAFPAYAAITADMKYVIRPHHQNLKQIRTGYGYAALDEADFTSFLLRFPGTREHVQLVGG